MNGIGFIMKQFLLIGLVLFSTVLFGKSVYVAPGGNDNNPGTFSQPFATVAKGIASISAAGDTVFVRGGVYTSSTTINISSSGTADKTLKLWAYPGEHATLDFSSMAVGSSNRGITLKGSYWYIKGIDIKGAGDNGLNISGSHNIIEFCAFYENQDSGCQLGGGASYNRVINCDSYYNIDPGQGNADGFSPKLDVGTGNHFIGCRSWQNSDDGWDGYLRPSNDVTDTLENCWCFMNGYKKDWSASKGNGNGFKMGGSDNKDLAHNFVLIRCISFDNRVKGFDQNNNVGSMTLINCTGYRNGTNYSISSSTLTAGHALTVINCTVSGSLGALSPNVQTTCNWSTTTADFLSLDTTGVRGPRKADGSLPDVPFLHLAAGSSLIDAGTPVSGLSYYGSAPDIGAFEFMVTGIKGQNSSTSRDFILGQNFPNPFNPSTVISYSILNESRVQLKVFDVLGNEITTLVDQKMTPGEYHINFDGNRLASGVYFYNLNVDGKSLSRKMLLTK
jgi:hypothetical protein